jgi:hypothetical protein
MLRVADKRFRCLNPPALLRALGLGAEFKDGLGAQRETQEAAA